MKEAETRQLETQMQRVSSIESQRRGLYEAIGQGRVRPDTFEAAVRIGRVKEKVQNSIEHYSRRGQEISAQLSDITNQDALIEQARDYALGVEKRKQQLDEIRRLTNKGHLNAETALKFEHEYRLLAARPGIDEDLRKGLELLRTRTSQEFPLETQSKPEVRINPSNKEITVTLGGASQSYIFEDSFPILEYLARHPFEPIPRRILNRILNHSGSGFSLQGALRDIRGIFPSEIRNQVVERVGGYPDSSYRLNVEVEFTGDSRPGVSKLPDVHQSRLNGLSAFLLDENLAFDKLIDILGISPKTGRKLSWPQAKSALKSALARLYRKNVNGSANTEEQNTWEQIQQHLGARGIQAKEQLRARIENWFQEKRNR